MTPDIALALRHFNELNARPNFWAAFEAQLNAGQSTTVKLEIGNIHPGGFKERALMTRTYYVAGDGKPSYTTQVHS